MPTRRFVFLVVAFAALLCVSGLATWAVWSNARQAQSQAAHLHERDLQSHEGLDTVRSTVYLTAILTRDYLLDPDPAHVRDYLDQFRAGQGRAIASISSLDSAANDPDAHSALQELGTELRAYWNITEVMLAWSPQEKHAQQTNALRQRFRQREQIFDLVERIERLTAQNSAQERERMVSADGELRSSLGWIAGAGLLLGVCISVFTLARVRTLEQQSQAAETELRQLSGQIRTAQEQERKSLSRELHDQVGQMLTGLRMELTAISRLQTSANGEVSTRLARAKSTVEQTLGIVRDIAMLLRPSMLDDLGLTPALNWLVREVSRSSGMSVQADVNPLVDELPDAHRTCLYRVVQEALTNATRHSGAGAVDLKVDCLGQWVEAEIRDDGRGFATPPEKRMGLGLVGMEERVREMGGSFRVVSAPGRGTSIQVRLPRPASTERNDDQDLDRGRSRDRTDRTKAPL